MAADARNSTVLGATIGKHRIVRLVGGGTVGRVFVCRNADLDDRDDRQVAIKVLRTKYVGVADKLMRDRSLVEKIASPYVAQVFDVAVYSNVPYVVSELVEGESLAALLARGPLRSADGLELARELCLGLQAAWAHGVAHGDVRPANVLLAGGDFRQAKLVDFMLAAPVEGTESVRGSPAYLAPEIMVGTPPDPLTDLYAVGCTLYECLTGKTPFTGSPATILHAQVNTPPPSLAAKVPGPQAVVDLVERLLEKDRSKRLKTYSEALEGIERALRGSSLPAPKKPQVPELDLDMDVEPSFDDQRTDEIHTSPAREKLISDEKPKPVAPPPKPFDDTFVHRSSTTQTSAKSPAPLAPAPTPRSAPVVAPLPIAVVAPVPIAVAAPVPIAAVAPVPIAAVAPVPIAVSPVLSAAKTLVDDDEPEDESTRVRAGIARPAAIPSAEDLGLVLEVVEKAPPPEPTQTTSIIDDMFDDAEAPKPKRPKPAAVVPVPASNDLVFDPKRKP